MRIYDSQLWISDLDEILETLPELQTLEEKSVLITGAAGLICSSVTDLLIRYNEKHDKKIDISVAGRWLSEMEDRFGDFVTKQYYHYVQYDASKTNENLNGTFDYIIHGASNASPNMIVKEPVETMTGNFLGMKNLLDLAKRCNTKRVLYISSSEVYGLKKVNVPYSESEYGFIELLNSRNSYSISKRATETLCVSYADEYGVDSVIVRPGHIYGPTASPNDNRVSSAWAYSAVHGEDIVMKSDGSQIRSYCYCLDCASAILKVLLCGESLHAYNISNPDSIINIKQMAEIIAEYAGIKVYMEVPTDEERKGFNPMSNSSLESSSLQKLGWHGVFDAKKGFAHTICILKEIM